MKALAYGEVTDGGRAVFQSVASLDGDNRLVLTFQGALRIDNPYRYLSSYLHELVEVLPQHPITSTVMDFTQMGFCNSNCFYVMMDIIDAVYNLVPGPVVVHRLDDDWQKETLPVLLSLHEQRVAARTTFEDVKASD